MQAVKSDVTLTRCQPLGLLQKVLHHKIGLQVA